MQGATNSVSVMNTLTVELPFDVDPEDARLLLTMKLFEEGRVSLGKAAEMAGYTKRTYMELLGRHGIPVFNYPPEELDRELAAVAEPPAPGTKEDKRKID
jgi:predicted HTH domain antitoxin